MLDRDLGVSLLESEDMAKKKPSESARIGQEIIIVYKADKRVSSDFKAWLEGLADKVKAPVTVLLDMALNEFAEKRKYKAMPARLYRRSKGE
jgi:hypothetical protein